MRKLSEMGIISVKQTCTKMVQKETNEVTVMSNALLRLRESSHNFSSTEKEIARIILDNPQLVVT